MSAFLGPVHQKMYNKILHQDILAENLLRLASEQEWDTSLINQINQNFPAAVKQPLEDIIEQNNIHGWLSIAVEECEKRFAGIICALLAGNPERLTEMKRVMEKSGQQYKLAKEVGAEAAYNMIHDILLDGMPCDFPFEVIQSGEDTVVWQVIHCPHLPYWEAQGYDVDIYYQLRSSWIKGTFTDTGLSHTRDSQGMHRIRKES